MEQTQDSTLFGLGIDPISKTHLGEAARWAKFIAILGFIFCGFIVLMAIFAGSLLARMGNTSTYDTYGDNNAAVSSAVSIAVAVYYIIIATVVFFGYLFLYRFATKMKTALLTNDQEVLNSSFQNLKIMFRYVGILFIIGLALMVLGILVVLAGVGASRM
jgi:hypothetical protein